MTNTPVTLYSFSVMPNALLRDEPADAVATAGAGISSKKSVMSEGTVGGA
jgi:hypothetical protein